MANDDRGEDGATLKGGLARPSVVVAADWSVSPAKRWLARAELQNGTYAIRAPEQVGALDTLMTRLRSGRADNESVLLGLDFPIGLPAAYADIVGVSSFRQFLHDTAREPWPEFFSTSNQPAPRRPFYPSSARIKGERSKAALADVSVSLDRASFACVNARPSRGVRRSACSSRLVQSRSGAP